MNLYTSEQVVAQATDYRRVYWTGQHAQLVTMAIPVGDDIGEEVRSRTKGRGPDSVIDAVGMEAHGSPVAEVGQRLFNVLPKRLVAPLMI